MNDGKIRVKYINILRKAAIILCVPDLFIMEMSERCYMCMAILMEHIRKAENSNFCLYNKKGIVMSQKIYPRSKDRETIYLKSVISNPNIIVGDYTMYNDFLEEPREFEKNNVLYQYPINQDKLIISKFCSIACGAKFIFNSANHNLSSLSTYPFPIFSAQNKMVELV